MNEYDVVVIGGGAAGLSAALVLSRARRQVAVVDAGHPRNAAAEHMQGFLGSDGLPPTALLAAGRDEVIGYGAHLVAGVATAITPFADSAAGGGTRFDIRLDGGESLRTRQVLMTTGLRDEIPDLPGVRERWGRELLHCPYCHGYEVRDQPLGVLGGTAEALAHAHLVRQQPPSQSITASSRRRPTRPGEVPRRPANLGHSSRDSGTPTAQAGRYGARTESSSVGSRHG